MKTWLRYLVSSELDERARLVNDAITAKKVALRFSGALRAIQASIGIIATWPRGDSSAVSMIAMKRASTTPSVQAAVQWCRP
jgi:hypothetical protein